MTKLADGLYHQRRAGDLLAGQQPDPAGWVDAGGGRRWRPPNISSLARGRGKLGPAPVRFLFEQVTGPIGDGSAPGVSCCGLRVISIDGSTSDVPDSEANDEHFGRPSNQARDGAFRQVRWLAAAESGTGSLPGHRWARTGTASRPWPATCWTRAASAGDADPRRPQVPVLGAGAGVPRDGCALLWRASAAFILKPVKVLADGTYLAEFKPPRTSDGPPLAVRVIEYTVHTAPGNGGGDEAASEVFCLVTDLLDPQEYPALDLACCYPRRWGCETVIGHHKTDMGEGQPVLRSKDPAASSRRCGHCSPSPEAICKITGIGAAAAGIPRDKISFPHALAAATDSVAAFSLSRLISHSPHSCSRSSPRAPSHATARTGPALAGPRSPVTSRPASPASRASPASSGKSSSTCSART